MQMLRANPACDETELSGLSEAVGATLPASYVAFLRAHNGGVVSPSRASLPGGGAAIVAAFLEARRVVREKGALGERMGQSCWPIAEDDCGNYFALCDNGGWQVVFWDHETEEEIALASSFDEFVDRLRPFDPGSVKLAPGQVIGAWVDPSLRDWMK